jgi:hypothetical protein
MVLQQTVGEILTDSSWGSQFQMQQTSRKLSIKSGLLVKKHCLLTEEKADKKRAKPNQYDISHKILAFHRSSRKNDKNC